MLFNEKKDVEESIEVMLIPEKETTYEGINENFFQGGGGGLALILSLCERVEVNFCLMGGVVWLSFGAYFTHFSAPRFQVIIAQPLNATAEFAKQLFAFALLKEWK